MSTTLAPAYPPASKELDEDFSFIVPVSWTDATTDRLAPLVDSIKVEARLVKIRATLQYQLCEMHRKGKLTFNRLCSHMIRIEETFKEVIHMKEDCVFARYLTIAFAKGGNVPSIVWQAVKAIYKDVPTAILKEGLHQEILRQLFIWTANDIGDKHFISISERRRAAARTVLILIKGNDKHEAWSMDSISESEALDIMVTMR